jgi:hypothetical protein
LDYFERLVTNHTVRFYTVLLADYKNLSPQVEHYVFTFLQRMYSHKIESDKFGVIYNQSSKGTNNAPDSTSGSVTLSYMLFNIRTLFAIHDILLLPSNSGEGANHKHCSPLVRLLLCVVRSFAELAQKNHLLYVECLFQHPHPFDFCFTIDTVYDAANFAANGGSGSAHVSSREPLSEDELSVGDESDQEADRSKKPKNNVLKSPTQTPAKPASSPAAVDYDFGDEFDENELPSTFMRLKKVKDKARKSIEKSSDKSKTEKARKNWTADEDEILRSQFSLYHNTYSCYDTIAAHEGLRYVFVIVAIFIML